jgi:micrococcal nuclease
VSELLGGTEEAGIRGKLDLVLADFCLQFTQRCAEGPLRVQPVGLGGGDYRQEQRPQLVFVGDVDGTGLGGIQQPHPMRTTQELVGERQTGHALRDAVEHARAIGLLDGLERLPVRHHLSGRVCNGVTEDVRMAADHLLGHVLRDILKRELPRLRGNIGMKDHLVQHVTQLFEQFIAVTGLDRLHEFVGLLDEVLHERLMGLLAIPGASPRSAQARKHGDELVELWIRAGRGRIVDHVPSLSGVHTVTQSRGTAGLHCDNRPMTNRRGAIFGILGAVLVIVLGLGWFGVTQLDSLRSPTASSTSAGQMAVKQGLPAGASEAVIEYVHDGDTLFLRDGRKVRLLGIDTPEIGKNLACYGTEATQLLRELLPEGSRIWVLSDVEPTDRYGRSLLFVYSEDGTNVNMKMLERGAARVEMYSPNLLFQTEIEAVERGARDAGVGLWGECG